MMESPEDRDWNRYYDGQSKLNEIEKLVKEKRLRHLQFEKDLKRKPYKPIPARSAYLVGVNHLLDEAIKAINDTKLDFQIPDPPRKPNGGDVDGLIKDLKR